MFVYTKVLHIHIKLTMEFRQWHCCCCHGSTRCTVWHQRMQIIVVVVFGLLVIFTNSWQMLMIRSMECKGSSRRLLQVSNIVAGQSVGDLQQAVSSPAADHHHLLLLQQNRSGSSSLRGGHVVVDLNASRGHFTSVQAAVNSIPDGNPDKLIIQINAGTYLEKVVVTHNLPYLTFQGAGAEVTTITWHDIASDLGSDGQQLTAYNTASVTVFAPHFIARNIAFRNIAPTPPAGTNGRQGAAFRISGDMAAFYSCSFFGGQDTLCDDIGRHYFKNCYIEGSIDFVFGNGQSIYMLSTLVSIAVDYGAFAAQDRQTASESTGFSFVNCTLTGTGYNYLGRAMGPYSRIIYAYSYIDNMLAPGGWNDWDHDTSRESTVTFGELKCWGPGANQKTRVPWSQEFTEAKVQPLYQLGFIDAHEWLTEV